MLVMNTIITQKLCITFWIDKIYFLRPENIDPITRVYKYPLLLYNYTMLTILITVNVEKKLRFGLYLQWLKSSLKKFTHK